MLKIEHIRKWFTDTETIGEWHIAGKMFCFCLEDPVRKPGVKIPGNTAIPTGLYKMTLTESARFKKPLPLLHDVPGFSGVRVHTGNGPADTEGCILLGEGHHNNRLVSSRDALGRFLARFEAAGNEATIDIRGTITLL